MTTSTLQIDHADQSTHAKQNNSGLARRDFSMRVKERMLMAGFAMLMLLMVTVIYNDLTRIPWIENLMPWR